MNDYARLHPLAATEFGIGGHEDQLPDFSPEGHQARAELARGALAAITAARPADESERVAKAVFSERIGLEVELHDAGLPAASLNVIASPVQDIRQTFDLMPTATAGDWAVIAARLAKVPLALAGYRASLSASADKGVVSASRQVRRAIEQCLTWSGSGGGSSFFATFAEPAAAVPGVEGALRNDLDAGVRAATEAYAELATFLREELAPKAGDEDAVGEDSYSLWSRSFIGAKLDLREAYAWGWEEFVRVEAGLAEVAGRIKPGAGPAEAAAALDADARYRVDGRPAFQAWMQELSDRALAELRGKHFDIPDELMRLECLIAPPGGGVGAYYTNPADDFSRPGRMWWSLPPGKEQFSTWREVSTVYHEGVPGHHLQIGTAVATTGLNQFQRLLCFVPAHGEGWALYAEGLMREFGYLDDGDLLGMLNKSLFRAARVIVDIGMHLKLEIPAGSGFHEGERWTPELGLEFLHTRTLAEPAHVVDEVDRYLGWPGQAPAYKLGERLWLSLRDEVKAKRGNAFDLKEFHMRALRSGPAGLDTMRDLLAAL
ncbi:DUF885 domain-containing protein [Amycolatopsis sp. H20-H5]|uniref:DUF885 domain-containing protein n=1 Tax=Amycolatopsis sp. H20-H5 TaxID=3046309 RepID=UPI002DBFC63B|nr:DUF885 domain-containing protein [Amycolatopsis sp. H20-H5]MEC3974230.1 DUF885 domain-containing protein [Amycolatopsis sp. H20-H5]